MNLSQATARIQLPLYKLTVFPGYKDNDVEFPAPAIGEWVEVDGQKVHRFKDGERAALDAKEIVCEVPKCGLTIAALDNGMCAALWESHGELYASVEQLRKLTKFARKSGNNLVHSPLNAYEADRLEQKFE